MHHHTKPQRVWLLPTDGPPRRLTEEELEDFFTHYPDTGWEPKLEKLYEKIGCRTVEMRSFRQVPGLCWLDEEGLLGKEEVEVNPVATVLYQSEYQAGAMGHIVAGTCVYIVHESCPKGLDDKFFARAFEMFEGKVPIMARKEAR